MLYSKKLSYLSCLWHFSFYNRIQVLQNRDKVRQTDSWSRQRDLSWNPSIHAESRQKTADMHQDTFTGSSWCWDMLRGVDMGESVHASLRKRGQSVTMWALILESLVWMIKFSAALLDCSRSWHVDMYCRKCWRIWHGKGTSTLRALSRYPRQDTALPGCSPSICPYMWVSGHEMGPAGGGWEDLMRRFPWDIILRRHLPATSPYSCVSSFFPLNLIPQWDSWDSASWRRVVGKADALRGRHWPLYINRLGGWQFQFFWTNIHPWQWVPGHEMFQLTQSRWQVWCPQRPPLASLHPQSGISCAFKGVSAFGFVTWYCLTDLKLRLRTLVWRLLEACQLKETRDRFFWCKMCICALLLANPNQIYDESCYGWVRGWRKQHR